jgi:hypothetical protein
MLARMNKNILAAAVVSAVLLSSSPSHAEDEQPKKSTWYGWQTLAADAGVVGATVATRNAYVFVGGYSLAAPIVHWAHGNVIEGFASLALRIAVPLVTWRVAYAMEMDGGTSTGHESSFASSMALIGCGLTSAFDAALLAHAPGIRF